MTARETILDNGYLHLVDQWGSDERIIESARMSTAKGFLGWKGTCRRCGKDPRLEDPSCRDAHDVIEVGDEKLLRYLYEHAHNTPFEFAGMVIEVQAPIFVFREWHRHRTQSYNEMSARYTPLPDLNYIPTVERLLLNSKTNKQAGTAAGAAALTEAEAEGYRQSLMAMYANDQEFYEFALRVGVPKELARIHLPVGRYSRMRASANLRNWLGFLTLRMAPTAQYEIRVYAEAVGGLIQQAFPRTWDLFAEGRR
jgi:thymidylate synthase (FAD)